MKLNQLRYICAVHKYGSISKAAKKLYISQPTLSIAIKDLENELGIQLLNRGKMGISFTDAGNVMVEEATNILSRVDVLTAKMRSISGKKREIRVGFSAAMSKPIVSMLLRYIDEFEVQHPKCKIHLMERVYNRQFDDLDAGITDLAFGKGLKTLDAHLGYIPLLKSEPKLCVGAMHPLARRDVVDIKDFIDEEILTFLQFDSKTNLAIGDWAKGYGYDISFHYYSQSSVVEELIRIGKGVALLIPKIYINNPDIVNVKVRNALQMEYGIFFRRDRKLCQDELDLIELIKNVLNEEKGYI